jgi:hypothetical protein
VLRRVEVMREDTGDVLVFVTNVRHLGVSYLTAWLVKHKLMEVMRRREEGRQPTSATARAASRGAARTNKVEFVAAVQATEFGEPVLMCPVQASLHQGVHQGVRGEVPGRAPATLVSDGLGCFTAVRGSGILHEPHATGGGAASAKHPSFQAVNTVLGNLKTALDGTYHAFGFEKYAHRYLAQVQYLFNRRFNLRSILTRLARAASQAKPCPLLAVRAAEPSC